MTLPPSTIEGQQISDQLNLLIRDTIYHDGPITFAKYMSLVLYAPGLGYYSAGSRKFGKAGDFVTAPEISSLFSESLALQCQQILKTLGHGSILELGAGSGAMAADLLQVLSEQHCLPEHYFILEISADLRERQQTLLKKLLPAYYSKIIWLEALPKTFCGVILANEVVDAMPVHRFQVSGHGMKEYYVDIEDDKFVWVLGEPSAEELVKSVKKLDLTPEYTSEINLLLKGWMYSLAQCLEQGAIIILDYGFPEKEFYHPQRAMGTLMCHYRHRAHNDPFVNIGLQDITAHVDFSALANAGVDSGLYLEGYTQQAQFLLNCGIAELAVKKMTSSEATLDVSQQLKRLTLPSEMGELFKVVSFTKNLNLHLIGFSQGNRKNTL